MTEQEIQSMIATFMEPYTKRITELESIVKEQQNRIERLEGRVRSLGASNASIWTNIVQSNEDQEKVTTVLRKQIRELGAIPIA